MFRAPIAALLLPLAGCATLFCPTCDDPLQIKRYSVLERAPGVAVMDLEHKSDVAEISGEKEHVVCWHQGCPTGADTASLNEEAIWLYFAPDPHVDPFGLKSLKDGGEVKGKGVEQIRYVGQKHFRFDSARITGELGGLKKAVSLAKECGDCQIVIIGHADAKGSNAYNDALSMRRAVSVRDWLASRGVPRDRIEIRGEGETAPVATNKTSSGRAKNRRAEFRVVINIATEAGESK